MGQWSVSDSSFLVFSSFQNRNTNDVGVYTVLAYDAVLALAYGIDRVMCFLFTADSPTKREVCAHARACTHPLKLAHAHTRTHTRTHVRTYALTHSRTSVSFI